MTDQINEQKHTCPEGKGECCREGKSWKHKASGAFGLLALSGSLLLLAMFFTTIKEYSYIGRDINSQTTISVSGDGESFATPDIATVSFSISKEAKTPAEARKQVDEAMKKIHTFLTESKVGDKDIKTTAYDLYPKYDYVKSPCIATMTIEVGNYITPCQDGKQVLSGYTVTQSVDVKIRALDDAGTVLGGLADNGATNLSGLNFTVEKPDEIQAAARAEAIKKAKAKAEELAKDLNVKLVRIVSYNEGGVYPVYNYARSDMKMSAMGAAVPEAANIPIGQNKYTTNVTITYEIR